MHKVQDDIEWSRLGEHRHVYVESGSRTRKRGLAPFSKTNVQDVKTKITQVLFFRTAHRSSVLHRVKQANTAGCFLVQMQMFSHRIEACRISITPSRVQGHKTAGISKFVGTWLFSPLVLVATTQVRTLHNCPLSEILYSCTKCRKTLNEALSKNIYICM